MRMRGGRYFGYTLIEMLTALGIIALLAAILLPVFASVRRRGAQTTCVSNLKQIGAAIAAYAQDYDQVYPLGGDPVDTNTAIWTTEDGGKFATLGAHLRPLPQVLFPYTKQNAIWQCPSDSGGTHLEFTDPSYPLAAQPSYYEEYGSSYFYRTEIAFEQKTIPGLVGYDYNTLPPVEHGPAEISILHDGLGRWHGNDGRDENDERRYNSLMGDGHVSTLSHDGMEDTWSYALDELAGF